MLFLVSCKKLETIKPISSAQKTREPSTQSLSKDEPENFGDLAFCTANMYLVKLRKPLPGVGTINSYWHNNSAERTVLTVKFLNGGNTVHGKVILYAKEWENHANIRFRFVSQNLAANIRIKFDPGGSWSYLGKNIPSDQTKATMNFGWFKNAQENEFKRTVLHEFGHALGLSHEHSHPHRFIQWNKQAVYNYYKNQFSEEQINNLILLKLSIPETTSSTYDPASIMHYPVPAALTLNNIEIAWNMQLSPKDKAFIRSIYPFPSIKNHQAPKEAPSKWKQLGELLLAFLRSGGPGFLPAGPVGAPK